MNRSEYRVVSYEGGHRQEWLHTVTSSSVTQAGFLSLFYKCWPYALRGSFYVNLNLDGAEVWGSSGKVAAFIRKERAA